MRSWLLTALACSLVVSVCACSDGGTGPDPETAVLTGAYFGQIPPGMTPTIFVPEQLRSNDTWFWHGALAFTDSGSEFYLDLYYPSTTAGIQTRFMRLEDSVWTSIEPPSFTGNSGDASPSFTPDGNKVFFISNRANGGAYGVWMATRSAGGWSQPQPVSIPGVPNLGGGWEVSVTRDETLYLRMQDNTSTTDLDIYRSRLVNGVYAAPERLGNEINSPYMDLAPYVHPDEDYLIFESARPGGVGGIDLYVSFHTATGSWTTAVNLGSSVNSSRNEGGPYVSPDGLYLFFNSNRAQQADRNPYWVDAQVIEALRPGS
ncbi:hypothetical protein ACFL3B_03970 [Gemmatimonadota bacterium]